jgi:hypothetical protein
MTKPAFLAAIFFCASTAAASQITNPSATGTCPGSTCILNQNTLQSGSTFYTSSGTVDTVFTINGTGQSGATPVFNVIGGTMTVNANGNVGIGVGTNTVTERLTVLTDIGGDGIFLKDSSRYLMATYKNGTAGRLDVRNNGTISALISGNGVSYFNAGNFGINTVSPTSLFSVGSTSQFQVNSSGNIVNLNNVTTSFPSTQGAKGSFYQNDGAGNISWSTAPASFFAPSNPTGTTSLFPTTKMMGLGSTVTITPSTTGRILFICSLTSINNTGGDGGLGIWSYGTGSAPANGVAATGTGFTNFSRATSPYNSSSESMSMTGILTGLTTGTAYWFDLQLCAVGGGTESVQSIGVSIIEF